MYRRISPLLLFLFLALSSVKAAPPQNDLPGLVRRLKPTVVAIVTYDAIGEALMTGSGFFLRPGQVVTNLHVLRGASRVEIKTLDGKGKVYPVTGAVAVDEEGDLALLAVETPPERARSSQLSESLPDEGERIFVIGNPLRLEGSVSDGIVSAVREVPKVGRIIQITAPISHGNSGSPIFNLSGEVVGVVTVKVTNGQNINLAIGSARIGELTPGKVRPIVDLPAKNRNNDMGDSVYRTGLDSLWLGNYDNAVGYFETAVNKNPKRADAWIQVGYCKVKLGKNEEAIKAYQQALQLTPDSEEVHNKLGDAYYYAGKLPEAIASYKSAARLRPANAEAHYNLAVAYFESGSQELGLEEMRVLRRLDEKLYSKLASEMPR
ncbi:MAG TPA: tetratricopeptide repeat-containing serine protease family protein [Pyrinomonadaceae bacterium]|nr:tetratricopeptide repeat-containing serine protease family protein [Pyrinomonadaceae bacterium]